MKFTKTIVAVLLGIIMALAPLSVSVYAGGDAVDWNFYDEEATTYKYCGEAKLGKNVFTTSFSAMQFTADKAGLYVVSCADNFDTWYGFSDKFSSWEASDIKEYTDAVIKTGKGNDAEYDYGGMLFSFKKGETQLLGVDELPFFKKATIEIKYIGKFKDLVFEESDRTYIIDQDIYGYRDDDGVNYVDFYQALRVVTDKTDEYAVFPETVTGKLRSGKCTLTAKALGHKDTFTIKCAKVTDFIKKAEFPKGFEPVIKTYYDGTCNFEDFCPDTIIVTMKDGTKKTVKINENGDYIIETGKDQCIYLGVYTWWNDDDTCEAYIGAGREEWARTPCTYKEVSFLENTSCLNANIINYHIDKYNWISYDFQDNGPLYGFRYIPTRLFEAHEYALNDVASFCDYYLESKG